MLLWILILLPIIIFIEFIGIYFLFRNNSEDDWEEIAIKMGISNKE